MDVQALRAQHQQIEVLAKDLLRAVSSESRTPVAPLRWRLARSLMSHLAIEDRYLYPSLIGSGDPVASETAQRFQAEMGGLATAFSNYMSNWPDHQTIANWPGFCRETREVIAALLNRVTRENKELYVLIGDGEPRPRRLAS